jgi:Polyketide cyclase / dehydrase and lipid transport
MLRAVAEYAFVSRWVLEAPIERVWDAIAEPEAWPRWWRYVKRVELLQAGDAAGLGAVRRYTWRTALPYSFVFDTRTSRLERPHLLEAQATGELVGTGLWQLSSSPSTTTVQYDWNVRTTRAWMDLLAPIARPAFAWNHARVMRQGGHDLARYLNARLLSAS